MELQIHVCTWKNSINVSVANLRIKTKERSFSDLSNNNLLASLIGEDVTKMICILDTLVTQKELKLPLGNISGSLIQ